MEIFKKKSQQFSIETMNNKKREERKMKRYILMTAILGILAVSSGASATDGKNSGGALCKNQNDGDANDFEYNNGYIRAKAGSGYAICPIIRDSMNEHLEHVWVYVSDPSSSSAVECSVIARSPQGSSGASLTANSGISATGSQTINLDVSWSDMDLYFYYIRCSMPDESAIYSYRWDEDN